MSIMSLPAYLRMIFSLMSLATLCGSNMTLGEVTEEVVAVCLLPGAQECNLQLVWALKKEELLPRAAFGEALW